MRKDEGDTIGLYFKVSPEEMEVIKEKRELAGTASKRAYLRKKAVDGYIIRMDSRDLKGLMKLSVTTIEYFKAMSDESGIPYQVIMNYYLDDCVKQQKKLQFV